MGVNRGKVTLRANADPLREGQSNKTMAEADSVRESRRGGGDADFLRE